MSDISFCGVDYAAQDEQDLQVLSVQYNGHVWAIPDSIALLQPDGDDDTRMSRIVNCVLAKEMILSACAE